MRSVSTLLVKVLSALAVYRRATLVQASLGADVRTAVPHLDLCVTRLDAQDLEDMVRLRGDVPLDTMRDRLDRGHICIGGRLPEGQLVCLSWGATTEASLPYLKTTFRPSEGQAYVYDSFASPEHRGRGVAGQVMRGLHEQLAALGCREAIGAVVPENRASLRYLARLGYREFGRFGFAGLGPWRRYFGGVGRATSKTEPSLAPRALRRSGGPSWSIRLGRIYARIPWADQIYETLFPVSVALRGRRLRVVWIEGRTYGDGDPGALVVADTRGSPNGADELADRFFEGAMDRREIGTVRPSGFRCEVAATQEADLTIVRIDRLRRRLVGPGYLACPEWVGTRAPVAEDGSSLSGGPHDGGLGSDLRSIEQAGFAYEVSVDPAAFETFYRDAYAPFVRGAHGARAVLRSEPVLRRAHRRGGILWVMRGGARRLGALFRVERGTLHLMVAGASPGVDHEAARAALKAVYRFGFEHARSLGLAAVDLGGSRPWLADGVLRYKRKWGAAVTLKPDNYHYLMVRWPRYSSRVSTLLRRAPLIFLDEGRLSAATALAPGVEATEEALEKRWRKLSMSGIARLYVLSDEKHDAATGSDRVVVRGAPPTLTV